MALTKQKKEEIVKQAADVVENANSVVFVNFHGLSVTDASEMRSALRKEGVSYVVVKKTLLKRVLQDAEMEGDLPELEGEIALAYGEDMVLPAKGIAEFQKKFENAVSAVGGILEKRYLRKEEVVALAKIPSREVLLGQFVMVINAPVQQTVQVLNGMTQSFVSVLHQVAEAKN
ncbi:50S ribosomal protein L10 [bacterium]|nr:50S ribosomal protein L10 [bacterium]|tara:strand:- start:16420 stop:16941 length:522 start_codon:yes stop_codon:yes gene_type:complete